MNVKLVTKQTINEHAEMKLQKGFIPKRNKMAGIVSPGMMSATDQAARFDAMQRAETLHSVNTVMTDNIIKYGGAMFVPQECATLSQNGKQITMSVYEMMHKGLFGPDSRMSANTLITDWQKLWDAMRIDISIAKEARPTIRENFYNVIDNPDATRTMSITEIFPPAFPFQKHNGEGQSVVQGETRGGETETVTHDIFAVGFQKTLLEDLYNLAHDPQKLIEAVTLGYNATRDDYAISPILNFAFSGVDDSQTPADATGTNRQEKLYNTLENALDHFARRTEPSTGRHLVADGLVCLCEPEDGRHIQRVVSGFTGPNIGGQDSPKNLGPIPQISTIVTYDGEVIRGRTRDYTFPGVTRGKCYLIKPNRMMNISVKRDLQLEVDMQPDVNTLTREQRAWWYAEGIHTRGIQYFVQEVTLPAYTPNPS